MHRTFYKCLLLSSDLGTVLVCDSRPDHRKRKRTEDPKPGRSKIIMIFNQSSKNERSVAIREPATLFAEILRKGNIQHWRCRFRLHPFLLRFVATNEVSAESMLPHSLHESLTLKEKADLRPNRGCVVQIYEFCLLLVHQMCLPKA